METTMDPRVYVACLACYNAGKLEGAWFDADSGLCDDFEEWRKEHVASVGEEHEEYLVHDSEGFDNLGEVSVPEAQEIGEFLTEHGNAGRAALKLTSTLEEAKTAMEERYQGEHDSLEAWGEDYLEQTGGLQGLPENLRYYFDFEKFARDCEYGGDITSVEIEGKVHVFDNH